MKRFGEKLRALRKRDKLTMKRLSQLLEVSDSYISQMETGDKIPNIAMLVKIADIFGIDMNRLARDELELEG